MAGSSGWRMSERWHGPRSPWPSFTVALVHRGPRSPWPSFTVALVHRGPRSPWNDGQHDMRRVTLVMEDRLPGRLPARAGGLVLARVQVAVEAREIAGGDLEADAMAGQEDVAGGPEVDGEARHLARDEGRGG